MFSSIHTMTIKMLICICFFTLFMNTSAEEFASVEEPMDDSEDEIIKPRPQKCHGLNDITEIRCCIFPPFYAFSVAKKCGIGITFREDLEDHNVTILMRNFPYRCGSWYCILYEYGLVNDDLATINTDLLFEHLGKWAELNPKFEEVLKVAKAECQRRHRSMMPLPICGYSVFHICLRHFIKMNCPKIIDSPDCREQQNFYKECAKYF